MIKKLYLTLVVLLFSVGASNLEAVVTFVNKATFNSYDFTLFASVGPSINDESNPISPREQEYAYGSSFTVDLSRYPLNYCLQAKTSMGKKQMLLEEFPLQNFVDGATYDIVMKARYVGDGEESGDFELILGVEKIGVKA